MNRPHGCGTCGSETRTLTFPDRTACRRHMTGEEFAWVADLDLRAAPLGLRRSDAPNTRWVWPYGPNIHVKMRAALLDWALPLGARQAHPRLPCLHWAERGRCTSRAWPCTEWGASRMSWMDHVTAWLVGDGGRLLLAQPYGVTGEDRDSMATAMTRFPGLTIREGGPMWYGMGTTGVLMAPIDATEAAAAAAA